MKPHVLFLTLKIFSATGGIEKVSRIAGKALHELGLENKFDLSVFSAYDSGGQLEERYFPTTAFKGFSGNRALFSLQSILKGRAASLVILSHINLLPLGHFIKRLSPATKVILIAHGIEVWHPLSAWKKAMLRKLDLVLPVSRFTQEKMMSLYGLEESSLQVVNNCLDPFLGEPTSNGKSASLLSRYGLTSENKILLTLTRLSFKERYKGYDEVIIALKTLKKGEPLLKYLVVGKYDNEEKRRLERLIQQHGLTGEVIFTGFVPDESLADHFNLADIYIMPSTKEGFGIVFIEALFYGRPVIAGNVDGSVDAVAGGKLGFLVNPDRPAQMVDIIRTILADQEAAQVDREAVLSRFGFPVYKAALKNIILSQCPELSPKTRSKNGKEQSPILASSLTIKT